jgi:hypothetical protein
MVDANTPRFNGEIHELDEDRMAQLLERATKGYERILAERYANPEAQVGENPVARNSLQDIKVGRATVRTRRPAEQVIGPVSKHIGVWPIVYDYFPGQTDPNEDQGCVPALEFERGIELLEFDTYLTADLDPRVGLIKASGRNSYMLKLLFRAGNDRMVDLGTLDGEQLPAVVVQGQTLAQTFGDETTSKLASQIPAELGHHIFDAQILSLRGHANQPRADLI